MNTGESDWREAQLAPFQDRLDDDPDHRGEYLVDDGKRFKIFPDTDLSDGTPKWGLLEFDGTEWGVVDEDYELADLMRRIDDRLRATR